MTARTYRIIKAAYAGIRAFDLGFAGVTGGALDFLKVITLTFPSLEEEV